MNLEFRKDWDDTSTESFTIYISISFANIYKRALLVLINYKLRPIKDIYIFSRCIIQCYHDNDLIVTFIKRYIILYA